MIGAPTSGGSEALWNRLRCTKSEPGYAEPWSSRFNVYGGDSARDRGFSGRRAEQTLRRRSHGRFSLADASESRL